MLGTVEDDTVFCSNSRCYEEKRRGKKKYEAQEHSLATLSIIISLKDILK